jgi:hypothetical protein
MAQPSDYSPKEATPPSQVELPLRKVAILDPGFREEGEVSVLRPRILGMKPPSHPKDRRNIKFVAIALVIAGILFGILQYRQLQEVESDVASPSTGFIKSK